MKIKTQTNQQVASSQKQIQKAKKKPLDTLQDGHLEELDKKQGNVNAWSVLLHRQVVRRMATVKDGPESLLRVLDDDVWLHFRKEIGTGRVSMFVEIREHTTPEKIKRNWKAITAWRELLAECQGPWTGGGDGYFFTLLALKEEALKEQQPRKVHALIARRLNRLLEEYLRDSKKSKYPSIGLSHALSLLRTMQPRASEKDHEEWIADTLESISRGRKPSWASGVRAYTTPITGQNVRDRLDTWRSKWKKTTSPPTRDK